ncbi:FUSC family protein [Microcoleus sp. FACHB-831]|uniref:FUSC family protein n=1 Tax=Microcoleus sp. FACHB-831 TaxID=2692827 RepID=UPI0016893B92|nr:FUSC family membrane protein [Microcoleus sp. FACHB-831]MBD1919532.1 FUSC family protein [Microcoleus sp. FACHB-831]
MPSAPQRPLNWLLQQFQLKPGKPAISSGLRTLALVGGPIGVGILTDRAAASAIAVMAALFVGMVDVGGAYRQKATAAISATIGVTVALLIANLVSHTLWLAIPTTFFVIFIAGLAGLYGRIPATVSLVTSLMFVVSIAKFASFPNISTVLQQCALCLAGGAWATVLSLGLWVLRPYEPAMQAVAAGYRTLSKFIESASEIGSNPQDRQEWATRFLQAQDNVTQELVSARSVWTDVWTRQAAANLRGNQLLVLLEDATQISNSIVALVEVLTIASDRPLFERVQREINQVMEQLAIALKMLSKAIAKSKNSVHLEDLDRAIEALEHQWQILRSQVLNQTNSPQNDDYAEFVNISKITTSLKLLADQLHTDAEIVRDLQRGERRSIAQRDISLPMQPERSSIIDTLKNNLTFRSVLFRHALRLALIVTIAELLAELLQIPQGYWVTLTALVALKPDFGGTSQATVQRVIGTTLGGILGIALVLLLHNSVAIAICILLLMVAAMSLRPLSYGIFITLLTPVIILLLNVTGKGGLHIGVLRIADTLAGGVLALIGSYLLFPSWERQQLPTQLETTIRANLAYFQQVIASYLNSRQNPSSDSIRNLRHQAALENANAAAAAQRLFGEPRHVQGEVEPVTTLILYIRGFFSSVTTLAEHRREFSGEYLVADLKQFADVIVQVLENLADALQQGQPPQPLPALDTYLETIHEHIAQLHATRISEFATNPSTLTATVQAVRERTPVSTELDRIVREIAAMHSAIARLQK